jgi:hypothetical protein
VKNPSYKKLLPYYAHNNARLENIESEPETLYNKNNFMRVLGGGHSVIC